MGDRGFHQQPADPRHVQFAQERPPYETVAPAHAHGGYGAEFDDESMAQQHQQQQHNAKGGMSYPTGFTGEMGGMQFKGEFDEETGEATAGTRILYTGLALLQWALVIFLVVGAIWFYVRLPQEGHYDVILQGIHSKHHRLFIQRNMVNVYNHTTLGLAVFQGGLLIGSPTIPGSGLLIVNKRNAAGMPVPLDHLAQYVVEETDEHLYVHDPEGTHKTDMRKRGIQAYSPASLYSGINIRDQSNIAMNGGDILGVDNIVASSISANVQSQKNGSSAQADQIQVGMVVGFQLNGTLGLGFAPNPGANAPIVEQEYYLNSDDEDSFIAVRFNEQKFATLYRNSTGGPLLAIVGTLDANNYATYQGGASSILLDAGVVGRDMQACSLEAEDGTGASTVLIVYKSAIDQDLYARVCDLSVPTAPVCGPSTNVSTGDAGVNGVYVYAASGIALQSLTCLVHPTDGATTTKRWFVVAWTDSASGLEMAQQIDANVALPLPNTTVVTATRIVGIVDNLTDTSTSTDLANADKGAIEVERLQGGNFVTAWRTGVDHNEGKFEVDYINVTALVLQLVTRSPTQFVNAFDNLAVADWQFDISVSQREPYLLGGEKQTIFLAYNIGPSSYGLLFFSTLAVPSNVASPVGSSPWITSGRVQFSNDVNPLYTYAFPTSAGIFVEGVCSNQAIVSFVTGGVGVPQWGYTVLVNMAPTQACVDTGVCAAVSTRVPFSSGIPYLSYTLWRTLASDSFDCEATLTPFVTVYASYVDEDYFNSTINVSPGVAGEYTVSYAPLDRPRQIAGVVSAVYPDEGLVSYVSFGDINLCNTVYKIDGRSCPFEAPGPVYSCSSGLPTFSPYCADTDVNSPGQLLGYTDVMGWVQVRPAIRYVF